MAPISIGAVLLDLIVGTIWGTVICCGGLSFTSVVRSTSAKGIRLGGRPSGSFQLTAVGNCQDAIDCESHRCFGNVVGR